VRVPTDLSRYADWTTWLAEQGATDPDVRVVWVGGSAATGGYDEWSDLDVDLLCTPGEADAVHDRLVARARATFAVDHVWELPTSTWPDGRQCFINLQSRPGALAEPTRIIDLHISELSDRHRFVDVRRHGTPIVVHCISASRCPRWSGCYASSTARRSRQPATSGGDPSDGGASRR
jgi:predicted nucleotidyltransferase